MARVRGDRRHTAYWEAAFCGVFGRQRSPGWMVFGLGGSGPMAMKKTGCTAGFCAYLWRFYFLLSGESVLGNFSFFLACGVCGHSR